MSASASGSSAGKGDAKQRSTSHNDGSSTRAWTVDQKAAVMRVRKCAPTAFYDILGIEDVKTTVDENGIKKAYRKQSLLTHPDKNGYTGADEAFKMVSRAFQILGDVDKRRMFDQTGGDPDSRGGGGGGGGAAASPFSGFARGPGMRQGGFEAEISPEDLFRQFFGGGGGGGFGGPFGGGGLFDSGPGFVFNLGGGPGVRVHQFGGGRPQRRPQGQRQDPNAPPRTAASALTNLLPLILLFILPLLSSLFGSDSSSSSARLPKYSIDVPHPPTYTYQHVSYNMGVPYYVDASAVHGYGFGQWRTLDRAVEQSLTNKLNRECGRELEEREELTRRAQGWFSVDQDIMQQVKDMPMASCWRLKKYGLTNGHF